MRMKVAMALSATLALGALRAVAQDETRWTEVFSDTAEVVSVDTVSVTPLGDNIYRLWERSVSRTSSDVLVLARADIDCRLRLTRAVAVALPGFAPVRASEEDFEWTEILPGSRLEAEFRQVCATGGPAGGPR
jgi:hypothetical protein